MNTIRRSKPRHASVRTTTFNITRADNSTSRQIAFNDEFLSLASSAGATIVLPPPYNVGRLFELIDQSNMLRQCIDAYVTNTVLTGWEVEPIYRKTTPKEGEQIELESFIEYANSEQSLENVMESVIRDREGCGFGFLEVIRNISSGVSLLRHCPALWTRLCAKDPKEVLIEYSISRGRRVSTVQEYRRFRRFIQIINGQHVWFKEFGDPRKMDYSNGAYEWQSGFDPVKTATEIIHFKNPSNDSYGVPRWINQLPSIVGSREAEEVNMRYFQDNTVPPMMLLVGNGRLTSQSYNQLSKSLNEAGIGADRQNKIMLLEAVGEGDSLDGKNSAIELKVEKLTDARQSDGLFSAYDAANMAKVRSSFRLPPIIVGMSQDVNFACYDAETETLTDRGWIRHDQFVEGMKVAAVDPQTGAVRFEEPIDGVKSYEVDNVLMYSIKSPQQDQLVTPNHRMLYKLTYPTAEWEVKPVEIMVLHDRVRFRASVDLVGGEEMEDFEVPESNYHGGIAALDAPVGSIPGDLLLEWLGYYLGDGCIIQNGNAVSIGAKKERKLARFEELHDDLEAQGFRVRRSTSTAGTYFAVSHKGFTGWLESVAGIGSRGKRIPEFVFSLPERQLRIVFDAMMMCDGYIDTRPGRTASAYSSMSYELASGMQLISTLLGYRAGLRGGVSGAFCKDDALLYTVTMSDSPVTEVKASKHITRQRYTGTVYCFTVSTGVFITRRNGKVAIQGNTASTSAFVAESQVFAPERSKTDQQLNKLLINGANGLKLGSVKLVSRTPSITSPEMLIKTLTALNVIGSVTPRSAQTVSNKVLQTELTPYPEKGDEGYEEWMDRPISMSVKAGAAPDGGAATHDQQALKDNATKALEGGGNVGPTIPKHGSE